MFAASADWLNFYPDVMNKLSAREIQLFLAGVIALIIAALATLKLQLPESTQGKNPPFLVVSIDTNGVYYVDRLPVTFEQLKDRLPK